MQHTACQPARGRAPEPWREGASTSMVVELLLYSTALLKGVPASGGATQPWPRRGCGAATTVKRNAASLLPSLPQLDSRASKCSQDANFDQFGLSGCSCCPLSVRRSSLHVALSRLWPCPPQRAANHNGVPSAEPGDKGVVLGDRGHDQLELICDHGLVRVLGPVLCALPGPCWRVAGSSSPSPAAPSPGGH